MTVRKPWRTNQVTTNNTTFAGMLLRLNDLGVIPTLTDGSLLTGITAAKLVGKNYTYVTNNTTNIDAELDYFYYIPQANTKGSLGGNTVNINVPYNFDKITSGSKFGFEYIPTAGAQNGGQYTLTTPTDVVITAAGWTSFTLVIDDATYTNGQVYTSKQGANPSRQLYAYVNGTNLFWISADFSVNSLREQLLNFNINDRNRIATNRHYVLAGTKDIGATFATPKAVGAMTGTATGTFATQGNVENTLSGWAHHKSGLNMQNWAGGGVVPNLNIYWSSAPENYNPNQIQGYRQWLYFMGHNSSVSASYPSGPTYLMPAVSEVPEGLFFCVLQLGNYGASGGTTLSFGNIGRNATNTFRWSTTGTQPTSINCAVTTSGTCTTIFTDGSAWFAFRIENN